MGEIQFVCVMWRHWESLVFFFSVRDSHLCGSRSQKTNYVSEKTQSIYISVCKSGTFLRWSFVEVRDLSPQLLFSKKKLKTLFYTRQIKDIIHPQLLDWETTPEGGWQVQHPPIIPTIIRHQGQRQFKGSGSICLHSRAASMLLKWSDSLCFLRVLEARDLCVLLWRATGHLVWGE